VGGGGDAEKPGFASTSVEERMLDFRAGQNDVTCHAAQHLSLFATPLEFEFAFQEVERFWVTMDMQRHTLTRLHCHLEEAKVTVCLGASDLPSPLTSGDVMMLACVGFNFDDTVHKPSFPGTA
jgi:hypothetical protein